MDEHKEELQAETRRRHARATQYLLEERVTSWPQSKAAWFRWLEPEPAIYNMALQSVKAGVRRAVNMRVTPHPDVPQKDPAVRVKPQTDAARPAWAGKLRNGWHALRLRDKGARMVIFAVRCAGKFAAFADALASLPTPMLLRAFQRVRVLRRRRDQSSTRKTTKQQPDHKSTQGRYGESGCN
jgi:hypothetical protein